jgi:hypothetical protein
MRRIFDDRAAVYTWLLVTVAGVVVMLITGRPAWFIVGFLAGGVAAFVLVAAKARHRR